VSFNYQFSLLWLAGAGPERQPGRSAPRSGQRRWWRSCPAYLPDVFQNRHQALFFGLGAVGAAVLATGRVDRIGARVRDRLALGATPGFGPKAGPVLSPRFLRAGGLSDVVPSSGSRPATGPVTVLRDVSLAVPDGRVVAPGRAQRRGQDHACCGWPPG